MTGGVRLAALRKAVDKSLCRLERDLARVTQLEAEVAERAVIAGRAGSWLPIECAPRDGTDILVLTEGYVHRVRWNPEAYPGEDDPAGWECPNGLELYLEGTSHWLPCPPLPEVKG